MEQTIPQLDVYQSRIAQASRVKITRRIGEEPMMVMPYYSIHECSREIECTREEFEIAQDKIR